MNHQNRKLNSLETSYYYMNENQPFTVIACAHIAGELSIKILEEALDIMRDRHYYLSYSIQKQMDELEWVHENKIKIPLLLIESASEDQWINVCNQEMNTSLPSTAPMVKVILLKKKGGLTLYSIYPISSQTECQYFILVEKLSL